MSEERGFHFAGFATRIKNICISPAEEWSLIASQSPGLKEIFRDLCILCLIPIVFILISIVPHLLALRHAKSLLVLILPLAGIYAQGFLAVVVPGFISHLLSPRLAGKSDSRSAYALATYSSIPVFLVTVSNLLPRETGYPFAILGAIYAAWIFYLGATTVLDIPKHRAIGFTATVMALAFVAGALCALLMTLVNIAMGGQHS